MYIKKSIKLKNKKLLTKKKGGGFFGLTKNKSIRLFLFQEYKSIFDYFISNNRTNEKDLIKIYKNLKITKYKDFNQIETLLTTSKFFNIIKDKLLNRFNVKYIHSNMSSLCSLELDNYNEQIEGIDINITEFCNFFSKLNKKIEQKYFGSLDSGELVFTKIKNMEDKKLNLDTNDNKNSLLYLIESIFYYIRSTYNKLPKNSKNNNKGNNLTKSQFINNNIINRKSILEEITGIKKGRKRGTYDISNILDLSYQPLIGAIEDTIPKNKYLIPIKIGIGIFKNPSQNCNKISYNYNSNNLDIKNTLYTNTEENLIQNILLTYIRNNIKINEIISKFNMANNLDYRNASYRDYYKCWKLENIILSNSQLTKDIINIIPQNKQKNKKVYFPYNDKSKCYIADLFFSSVPLIISQYDKNVSKTEFNNKISEQCKNNNNNLYKKAYKSAIRAQLDGAILSRTNIFIFSVDDKYINQTCNSKIDIYKIFEEALKENIGEINDTKYKRFQFFREIYYGKSYNKFNYSEDGPKILNNNNNSVYINNYINDIVKFDKNKIDLIVDIKDYNKRISNISVNSILYDLIATKQIIPLVNIYNNKQFDIYSNGIKGGICSMGFYCFSKLNDIQYIKGIYDRDYYLPELIKCDSISINFVSNIIKHIKNRFDLLDNLLEYSENESTETNGLTIMVPSDSKYLYLKTGYYYIDDNSDIKHHYIGAFGHLMGTTDLIKNAWGINNSKDCLNNWLAMLKYIDLRLFDLYQRYPNKFYFGNLIGDSFRINPSKQSIHIFDATCSNWNIPLNKSQYGDGFITQLGRVKKIGHFGIVVNPSNINNNDDQLLDDDKMYNSDGTIKILINNILKYETQYIDIDNINKCSIILVNNNPDNYLSRLTNFSNDTLLEKYKTIFKTHFNKTKTNGFSIFTINNEEYMDSKINSLTNKLSIKDNIININDNLYNSYNISKSLKINIRIVSNSFNTNNISKTTFYDSEINDNDLLKTNFLPFSNIENSDICNIDLKNLDVKVVKMNQIAKFETELNSLPFPLTYYNIFIPLPNYPIEEFYSKETILSHLNKLTYGFYLGLVSQFNNNLQKKLVIYSNNLYSDIDNRNHNIFNFIQLLAISQAYILFCKEINSVLEIEFNYFSNSDSETSQFNDALLNNFLDDNSIQDHLNLLLEQIND